MSQPLEAPGGYLGTSPTRRILDLGWGEDSEPADEEEKKAPPPPPPVQKMVDDVVAPPAVAVAVAGKEYYSVDGRFERTISPLYAHGEAPHFRSAALLVYRGAAIFTTVKPYEPEEYLGNQDGLSTYLHVVLESMRIRNRVITRDFGLLDLADLDQRAWYTTHVLHRPGADFVPSRKADLQEFALVLVFLSSKAYVPQPHDVAAPMRTDVTGTRIRTMITMEHARNPGMGILRPISAGALAAGLLHWGAQVVSLVQPPPLAFETFTNITFTPAMEATYLS
jgi:hypothetical protein